MAQTTFLAFSADSKTLASASDDLTVRLWNPVTAREMTRTKLARTVRFLGFSPDGETLAIGQADDTVHLFHAPPMSQIEATSPATSPRLAPSEHLSPASQ